LRERDARATPTRVIRTTPAAIACLALATGCSSFSQIAAGPVIGRERSDGFSGGAVSVHHGLGGRFHHDGSPSATARHFLMPLGLEMMARVAVTTRLTSVAIGEGYYLTGDVGKHVAFGRVTGLLLCNASEALLCGGGVRAEAAFGFSLGEEQAFVPGYLVHEQRRYRRFVTAGVFGEYTGEFTRRAEVPMAGVLVGYAFESVLLDFSRGQLLR